MAKWRVQLFHSKPEAASELIFLLERIGYQVSYSGIRSAGVFKNLLEHPLIAAVIDLTHLPSYGRSIAAEIRSSKQVGHTPIVFVGGDLQRVKQVKAHLPDATFTTLRGLAKALNSVKPVADPVKPPRMMFSERPAALKLRIGRNMRVAVYDAPRGYARAIGEMPEGAVFEEDPSETLPITLWFVHDPQAFLSKLPAMVRCAAASRLWIIYPKQRKKTMGVLPQSLIRETALTAGLVDYKICSIDETWTGLAFAQKKFRPKPGS